MHLSSFAVLALVESDSVLFYFALLYFSKYFDLTILSKNDKEKTSGRPPKRCGILIFHHAKTFPPFFCFFWENQ